ncbi:MAG: glycosyltransferase family 2 protein [Bacteroidales bacterium]
MISIYIFWALLLFILYCYVGYPLILILLVGIKKYLGKKTPQPNDFELPEITILIAAYNEKDIVDQKVENTLSVNYPSHKIHQLWVTDGSNDGTPDLLKKYSNITLVHKDEREGKASAINHAMRYVKTPITIFSDANTMLSENSLLELVKPFCNPKVGCVAGEKQVCMDSHAGSSSTGEGIYWKYESFIKYLESETGSTLSAAGELFAIRTELFKALETNTILDDFDLSTHIAQNGHAIIYSKKAIATEKGSLNFDEEKKRKVRIAAGGFQTLFRRYKLLNPFRNPALTFKYLSHKVLRWTIVPLAILLIPFINLFIAINSPSYLYTITLIGILLFYGLALIGYLLKNNRVKFQVFVLPYYLIMMHIAEIQGFMRFIMNKQDVKWEKAQRET